MATALLPPPAQRSHVAPEVAIRVAPRQIVVRFIGCANRASLGTWERASKTALHLAPPRRSS